MPRDCSEQAKADTNITEGRHTSGRDREGFMPARPSSTRGVGSEERDAATYGGGHLPSHSRPDEGKEDTQRLQCRLAYGMGIVQLHNIAALRRGWRKKSTRITGKSRHPSTGGGEGDMRCE